MLRLDCCFVAFDFIFCSREGMLSTVWSSPKMSYKFSIIFNLFVNFWEILKRKNPGYKTPTEK